MENKWVVTVSNYHDINFEFDTANDALEFAELAKISAQPYKDYSGKVHPVEIYINATILKAKEEKEDE